MPALTHAQLNGTYTVGGTAPNYATLTDAVSALTTVGISGNVTFNIRPGTYAERVMFNAVTGSNASRTITFQSENGDSSSVVIGLPTATNLTNYIFAAQNTQNVVVKRLTFIGPTSGTHGLVVSAYNSSGFKMENCRVSGILSGATSTNQDLVQLGGTMSGYHVKNSTLRGGYRGVGIYSGSTSLANNGLIDQNKFLLSSNMAFRAQFANNLTFSRNLIDSCGAQSFMAVQINFCSTAVVSANRIEIDGGFGMGFTSCYSAAGARMQIHNNFVSSVGDIPGSGGIYLQDARYVDLYYNSFNIQAPNTYSVVCAQVSNGGAFLRIQNNIFSVSPNGIIFNNISGGTTVEQYSYNNLYNGLPVTDLPPNSVSFNPGYASETNLHLLPANLNNIGTPVSITTDIDGQPRSATTPDIGADEFTPVNLSAGIASLVNPSADSVYCDQLPLAIKLVNSGLVPLTSVEIQSGVNGVYTTLNWTGNLLSGQQVTVPLGNFPLLDFQSNYVEVQLNSPNGGTDLFSPDDYSIYTDLYTGLNGTYTIGGVNPTFSSFSTAMLNLKNGGICGNVTLKIRNGDYFERIFMDPIKGSSENAWIWFEGESGDSSLVELISSGSTDFPSTVRLNGASFIGFKHMSFVQNASVNNYTPLHITYGRDITLENCETRAYTSSTSSSSDHSLVAFIDSNLTIRACRITGGSIMACNLVGTGPMKYNLIIENSQIIGGDALDARNWTNVSIRNNFITGGGGNTNYAFYGLGLNKFDISNNYISANGAQGSSALYLINNGGGSGGVRNKIVNNSLNTSLGVDVIAVGMCLRVISTNNTDIWHNSVRHNSLDTDNFAFNLSNSSGLDIRNNIFANTGTGIALAYGNITNSVCDYNIYHTNGTVLIGGTNDLAYIQSITGGDQNSIVADPMYMGIAPDILQIGNPLLENLGTDLGITTDIRGFARTFPNPDMGAFESASAPNVDLGDDISACGSVLINGMVPGTDSYSWNVGGNSSSLLITQSGTYILTATNEIGSDSDTLVVEILPLPNANAGQNQQVCAGEEIQLSGSGSGTCTWISPTGTEFATTCEASIVLSQSGNLILQTTGINGCEAFDTLNVTIDALPIVPQITIDGAYLVASADGELQWYQDDQPIDGETGDSLAILGNGNFSVEATNAAGCSVISETVEVNVTGIAPQLANTMHVFPNPFDQTFSIVGAGLTGKNFSIIDQMGRVVLNGKFESDNQQINQASLSSGVYSIVVPERSAMRLIKIN
jgi:trimeric autotransporter adhesin